MLRMRLQRRGKRNYATYRVVVAEKTAPIKGRFVAEVGSYNPHSDAFSVKTDEVSDWLAKGVKPSATVHNLLVTHGIVKADKITSWRPKKKTEEEMPKAEKSDMPKEEATPATAEKQVIKEEKSKEETKGDSN